MDLGTIDLGFLKQPLQQETHAEWKDLDKLFPEAAALMAEQPVNYDAVRTTIDDFLSTQVDRLIALNEGPELKAFIDGRDGEALAAVTGEAQDIYNETSRAVFFCQLTATQLQNEQGAQKARPIFGKLQGMQDMLGGVAMQLRRELVNIPEAELNELFAKTPSLAARRQDVLSLINEHTDLEKYENPLNSDGYVEASHKLDQVATQQQNHMFMALDEQHQQLMTEGIVGVMKFNQQLQERSGFKNVKQAFLDNNKLEAETYDTFMDAASEKAGAIHQAATNLRGASFTLDPGKRYSWQEAKELVVASFADCHPEMGEVAAKAFDESWIYAVSSGVENAHALGGLPSRDFENGHPYAAVNFNGTLEDMQTLAHEMGHVVHNYLAGQHNGVGDMSAEYVLQETPSHFGELLLKNRLIQQSESQEETLAIKAAFDGKTATDITSLMPIIKTEQDFYAHIAQKGEQTTYAELEEIFQTNMQEMNGTAVKLAQMNTYFLRNNSPMTSACYPMPKLMAYSLEERMQQNPQFGEKFVEVLKAGGTITPKAAWDRLLGDDQVNQRAFWQQEFNKMDDRVTSIANQVEQHRQQEQTRLAEMPDLTALVADKVKKKPFQWKEGHPLNDGLTEPSTKQPTESFEAVVAKLKAHLNQQEETSQEQPQTPLTELAAVAASFQKADLPAEGKTNVAADTPEDSQTKSGGFNFQVEQVASFNTSDALTTRNVNPKTTGDSFRKGK